jgi:hypothetical protein
MKSILLSFTMALAATCPAQPFFSVPYNPDHDYNQLIGSHDLLEFLMVYGEPFVPFTGELCDTSIVLVSNESFETLSESILTLQSAVDSLANTISGSTSGSRFSNVVSFSGSAQGSDCGEVVLISQTVPIGKAWRMTYLPNHTIRINGVRIDNEGFVTFQGGTLAGAAPRVVTVDNIWLAAGDVITISKTAICGNCNYNCSYNVSAYISMEEYTFD